MRTKKLKSRQLGESQWHKLLILILGPLCGLLVTCRKPDLPLRVHVAGCALLRDQGTHLACATKVPDERHLILSIEGPPLARLRFWIGDTGHGETKLSPQGHIKFDKPFPKAESRVTLRVESDEGVAEYTLEIQTMPFGKASARLAALERDCDQSARRCWESAQQILAGLDAARREFDASEQAFLLELVGERLSEELRKAVPADGAQAQRELALSVLERSMAEARNTGLLSVEAWALVLLGYTLQGQSGEYGRNMAARLSDPIHKKALDECPEQSANLKYLLSWMELEQGNLASAKTLASEAAALAEEFVQDRGFRIAAQLHAALAAQSLHETSEAVRLRGQVEAQLRGAFVDDPCELVRQYNSLAWVKLVARQSGNSADDPDTSPDTSFEQVATFLPHCDAQSKSSKVADEQRGVLSNNRALYALLRAERAAPGSSERLLQLARAESMRKRARDDQTKAGRVEQGAVQQDLAYLEARIALLRGHGQAALRAFAQLEQLTTRWLAPHYRWASQIGQADAHLLLGEIDEAQMRYERVEALLDRMTAELPLTAGHQLFLSQFEAGTGRYLKLLLGVAGSERKILEVIRHARVRALHRYARGPSVGAGESSTDELLQQYWALLGEREVAQAQLRDAPLVEQEPLKLHIEQLKRRQTAQLEELYTGVATARAQLEMRPPAAAELGIACYPLPAEPGEPPPLWVCAGGTAGRTQVLRITAPTEEAPEQAALAILTGFGKALGQARQLRILPYGPLRTVAWASLPWAGRPLGEWLTISYGVDTLSLGGPVRPPLAGPRALLVTNPEQDLLGAHQVGEKLRNELPAAGWQLDTRAGAPRRGGHPFALLGELLHYLQPPPALASEVVASLPIADLFLYYGHAESLGPGGWDSRLRFAEDGSISVRDIMSLPSVPRKVLLIGCETAVSDREAPADEMGLAQAFVLRGSEEVLATTRKVADSTAAALVDKLMQLGALRPDGPPLAAALQDAITALKPRYPAPDLDAFRVYVP